MTTVHVIEHDSHHPKSLADGHDSGALHVHIVPPSLLLGVYAVLVLATIATVGITLVDLGIMNIWAALAIAVFKAALVILYFMHLRYDSLFNGIIMISALAFVMVFIGVALMDTSEYKMNNLPPGTRQMMSSQNGL
jgi:cytochrome c oxidase subunit 4